MHVFRLALVATAIAAPAHAAEKSFMVTDFSGVSSAGAHKIVVTTGKSPSVRAVGDREDIDRLKIEVNDGTLRIGHKGSGGWLNWRKAEPATIYVTTHKLSTAKLAGAGDMVVDRMSGDAVKLSLAGAGDLSVGVVKSESLDVSVAGSGDIAMTGTCDAATVSIAGSGNVEAVGLKCQTISAKVAGSGNIKADVAKTATLRIAGSGDIEIHGNAKCDVRTTGSGRVRCGTNDEG